MIIPNRPFAPDEVKSLAQEVACLPDYVYHAINTEIIYNFRMASMDSTVCFKDIENRIVKEAAKLGESLMSSGHVGPLAGWKNALRVYRDAGWLIDDNSTYVVFRFPETVTYESVLAG